MKTQDIFIKKNVTVFATLILIYFLSHLVNLDKIPIFTDEAIYIRWGQIMSSDLKFIYLPLTDGKPPLFMWFTATLLKFLPLVDPLIIGRMASVLTGFLSLVGIYFTSYQLFRNKMVSYLSALLYIFAPFTFFYDRFATADSMLSAWGIWSLGLGVLLVKTQKWITSLLLGLIIGLGLLTKTPGLFFLLYLPLLIFFFNFQESNRKRRLIKLGIQLFLVLLISRFMYSLIFLLPQAYVISLKNYEFIISFSEFAREPFRYFFGNLKSLLSWEIVYLTLPVVLLIALAFLNKRNTKEKLILAVYFSGHLFFMVFFNKVIYPRFLLTFTPMILILASIGFWELKQKFSSKIIPLTMMALTFSCLIFVDYKLLTDPINALIADNDSVHYLNSWSAGFGINEVRVFLASESKKHKEITLGTEGTFGLTPFALELYQKEYPNVKITAFWPPPSEIPKELKENALKNPTYYIIYQRDKAPLNWKVRLVSQYKQGKSNDYLKLYQVLPK